jgi:quinol monooxygenase YgiN
VIDPIPAVVTLHVWGVPRRAVPRAVLRMAIDRSRVRALEGLRFAKLLGTGDGRTFTVRDADPRHWGLLATWESAAAADAFELSPVATAWDCVANERLRVRMRPLASRGRWSGRTPFGDPTPKRYEGAVASITRARIRPSKAVTFWRAVKPVSADLQRAEGLRFAFGIGEAPIGLQGTFSVWDSGAALREFAHRRSPHIAAIQQTARHRWYAEELFARFAVLEIDGCYHGTLVHT